MHLKYLTLFVAVPFLGVCSSLEHVKIFTTSSSAQAIMRMQENETIECSQPEFDGHKCVSDSDFADITKALRGCK